MKITDIIPAMKEWDDCYYFERGNFGYKLRKLSVEYLKELLRQFRKAREDKIEASKDFIVYNNDMPEVASLLYNVTGIEEELIDQVDWDDYLGDRSGMIQYRIDQKEGR